MNYLFDTDSINFFFKQSLPQYPYIRKRVASLDDNAILQVSALSIAELEYSLFLASEGKKGEIITLLDQVRKNLSVVPFTDSAAVSYAEFKGKLKQKLRISTENMKKHNIDIMLASTALCENAVLISADGLYEKLAEMTPQFQYENWTV